jgi:hypothetical protein
LQHNRSYYNGRKIMNIMSFFLLWLLLFGIYILLFNIYDFLILGIHQGYCWFIRRVQPKAAVSPKAAFPDLQLQLQELAKIAWTTEKAFREPDFLLSRKAFVNITEPGQVVEVLMRHAKLITPGFQVPYMVPRVVVTPTLSLTESFKEYIAGTFEEDEEGWVEIKVNSKFFGDKLAAQAILAHEVCHYILANSGIRKRDFKLNERYTDLCMFICGFGEIFLSGYQRKAGQHDYRPGHRLGYLTDVEYKFAHQYVIELRQSNTVAPPSDLEALRTKLLQRLQGDKSVCNRLIKAARQRNPDKPLEELYRDEIYRLERDRGR